MPVPKMPQKWCVPTECGVELGIEGNTGICYPDDRHFARTRDCDLE